MPPDVRAAAIGWIVVQCKMQDQNFTCKTQTQGGQRICTARRVPPTSPQALRHCSWGPQTNHDRPGSAKIPSAARGLGRQVPPIPRGSHAPTQLFTLPTSPEIQMPATTPNPSASSAPSDVLRYSNPSPDEVETAVLSPERAVHRPEPTRACRIAASSHPSRHPPTSPRIAEAPCPPHSRP